MDQLEKVEKIREKTGVSYEEAKAALTAANGDLLDALVYMENQGKIKEPEIPVYSTKSESSDEFKEATRNYDQADTESFGDMVKRFVAWCGEQVKKGCENFFIVSKNHRELASVPVIVIVILLIFMFWCILPLSIVGLFFGFRYSFRGNITKAKSVDLNKACDAAANACDSIKQEFTKEDEK